MGDRFVRISPFPAQTVGVSAISCTAGGCIGIVENNSYFQQNAMMRIVRNTQWYFWEKRSDWRSF
jgi:hypothetical protein